MGPFIFQLLWPFGNVWGTCLLTTFPLHWDHKHNLLLVENTLRTAPRLPSPPTPSHSIPQKQPACVHNFSCLLLWPQTISLRLFAFIPGISRFLWSLHRSHHLHTTACGVQCCTSWQEGQGMSLPQNLPASPPHAKSPLITEHAKSHQTQPTFWPGAGMKELETCLAAPALEHSWARLAQYLQRVPAHQRTEKTCQLSASVMLPLPCIWQKTPCCMWPPAENLPTQRRGPQVGAMLLSLTGAVPLCRLVKPIPKQPVTYVQGLCHLIQVI